MVSRHCKAMQAMANELCLPLPKYPGARGSKSCSRKVVVITGTTGTLGSCLLADLISDDSVSRVYALNRANKKQSLEARQRKAFQEKGLDEKLLDSGKVKMLVVDLLLEKDHFGLSSEDFQEMKSVTHIVHNAWPLDLTARLPSFKDNMASLRNLLDFAIISGANFIFMSSVAVFINADLGAPLLERPTPAWYAEGLDYAESKWVAEQIVLNAYEIGLGAQIIRLGQLCGLRANNLWDQRDWPLAIIQSAKWLRCIPSEDRVVTWMHPESASRAIIESLNADLEDRSPILHIRHPSPIPWSTLANRISSQLRVETVTFEEWFARLHKFESEEGEGSGEPFYARRLLKVYEFLRKGWDAQAYPQNREAIGSPLMDIGQALKVCPSLREKTIPRLGEEDAKAWLINLSKRPICARL
ncbi:hypothetical protein V5O48_017429 [Marasmius crinis-equi]|uniref:Thioester reductase (TE) domain-containing protein n=1 Tax=Marasmius crinis-equi TaxID=585013 RepID=A0ABR3EP03_9AGAR